MDLLWNDCGTRNAPRQPTPALERPGRLQSRRPSPSRSKKCPARVGIRWAGATVSGQGPTPVAPATSAGGGAAVRTYRLGRGRFWGQIAVHTQNPQISPVICGHPSNVAIRERPANRRVSRSPLDAPEIVVSSVRFRVSPFGYRCRQAAEHRRVSLLPRNTQPARRVYKDV
jgi:hypothetical protein